MLGSLSFVLIEEFTMKTRCFGLGIGLVLLCSIAATAAPLRVAVTAGDHAGQDVVVKTIVLLDKDQAKQTDVQVTGGGQTLAAQLTAPSLLAKVPAAGDRVARELHFVVPKLEAKQEVTYEVNFEKPASGETFAWKDTPDKYMDLAYGDKPVLRYMHERVDNSSKERRSETFKVYHHVYNQDGTRLLTKGPGGLFPHHRGVYYGFNKISYDGKTADTWHCNNGESQTHEGEVSREAGRVLGRHTVKIDWHGKDDKVFAKELREITVYRTNAGTLLEFASRLESAAGPVKLDGDPQHAGFQFRASQDVPDKTKAQTYYLRPDGKGEPGKFRNWPGDKMHANLPWNALSIVLDGQRYTVCYLDRPENPKESRFSERDYGRFGSYFEAEIDKDKPLDLNYRLWIQPGEMTVETVDAKSKDFVSPPKVQVKG